MNKKTKKETVYVLIQSDTYRENEEDISVCASKEDAKKKFKECIDYYWDPDDRDGTDNNGNTYEECLDELRYDDGMHDANIPNKAIQKQLDEAKDLLRSYEPSR